MKITKKDFEDYVSGWLFVTDDFKRDSLDMDNIHAALANALGQLHDDQDGIEAYVERKEYSEVESLNSQVHILEQTIHDLRGENHKLSKKEFDEELEYLSDEKVDDAYADLEEFCKKIVKEDETTMLHQSIQRLANSVETLENTVKNKSFYKQTYGIQ